VEALATLRRVHVGSVPREQHAPLSVRGRLASHVGEARDPGWIVRSEVCSIDAEQGGAQFLEVRLARVGQFRLLQHDLIRSSTLTGIDWTNAPALRAHPDDRRVNHLYLSNDPTD